MYVMMCPIEYHFSSVSVPLFVNSQNKESGTLLPEIMDIELQTMNSQDVDSADFYKIAPETKNKIRKVWRFVAFGLSWLTVVLYIWDCVASFLSYNYWMSFAPKDEFRDCLLAWLAFSIIGTVLAILLVYNTVMHSLKNCGFHRHVHSLSHQYSACIEYYSHEIPKSIVFLVIMIKFSIIPDDSHMLKRPLTTVAPAYYLGHTKYDHIYYKIIFDALKMIGFFALGVIEFFHILRVNRSKVFLYLNTIGETLHLSLLIATTVYKIKIELT